MACTRQDLVELQPGAGEAGSAGSKAAGGGSGGGPPGVAAEAGGARSSDDLDAGIADASLGDAGCVPPSWYPEALPDAGDAGGGDRLGSARAWSCAILCHDKFVYAAYWASGQGYDCEPVDERQCNEECIHPAVDCPEYWAVVSCTASPQRFQGEWDCATRKAVMRGCEYFERELATSCRCRP